MKLETAVVALIVTCLAAAASSPAWGEDEGATPFTELSYRVVTTNETTSDDVKRKTPLVPRVEGTMRAVLGPRRVEVEEDGRRVVLDYENERELRVEADGAYHESSLIATVAFLDMEMSNRARIAKALATAGMKEPSSPPREVSILFGVRAKGDETTVSSAADGAATVFRDGDEELARWAPSAEKLDEPSLAALSRFLQRRCRLHPDARAAIVADGRAPAALRFRWHDVGVRSTTEMTLISTKRLREPSIDAVRRVFDDADPLESVARRVLAPSKEDLAARLSKDDFVRLAKEARAKDRFEDAGFLLIECGLQTGDAVIEELRGLRSDEAARPRVDATLGAMGSGDPKAQLERLDKLDRALFSRPHVLDVFRANCLAQTRRVDEGITTMLGALSKSPWLAGAWKDVGDMHYARFDTRRTWLAWEAGRRATPDHEMWQQVREFEERLRKRYRDLL